MTEKPDSSTRPIIEPQYVLAAVQMAANLNTLIWQKATVIFAVQSATIAAGYAARGTLLSYLIIVIGLLVSLGITTTIGRDIKRRSRLLEQANYVARAYMNTLPPTGSQRNSLIEFFDLYPFPIAEWARHGFGTFLRMAVVVGVNRAGSGNLDRAVSGVSA